MRLWPVVALLVAACSRPAPGPLHFCREEVWLDARPGLLEVRATYHFICSARQPIGVVVSYPFPIDSANPFPDSIEIPGYTFKRNDTAVTFVMHFRPGQEDSFFAYYRQRLRANAARYIVTSTRKWQRPIDRAQFCVTAPAGLDVKLSYGPDSTVRRDSLVDYWYTSVKFWPDKDVVVTW